MLGGRANELRLNQEGRLQAQKLAGRLAGTGIRKIFSSPVARALETAEVIGRRLSLEVESVADLSEIDYGAWTGKHFAKLHDELRWQRFNSYRSGTRIPEGESMLEAQTRFVSGLERLSIAGSGADGSRLAIISHGDLIKAALAHFVGIHLDLFQRIEIYPASVSTVELRADGPRVICINNCGDVDPRRDLQ